MQFSLNKVIKRLPFFIMAITLCGIIGGSSCDRQVNQQGKRLYTAYCASCHMENGEGLRQIVPALTDKEYLHINRDKIACMIREGISGPMVINGKKYDRQMPGIPHLDNIAIHNIINYVFQSWGNDLEKMNLGELNRHMEACKREFDDRRLEEK